MKYKTVCLLLFTLGSSLFGAEEEKPDVDLYGKVSAASFQKWDSQVFPFEIEGELGAKAKFPQNVKASAALALEEKKVDMAELTLAWSLPPFLSFGLGFDRPELTPGSFTGGKKALRGSESRLEDWLKDQGYRPKAKYLSVSRGYEKGTLPLGFSLGLWFDGLQYSPLNTGALTWYLDGKDSALGLWGGYQPLFADDGAGARVLRYTGLGGGGFFHHKGPLQAELTLTAGTDRPRSSAPGTVPETRLFWGGTGALAWEWETGSSGDLALGISGSLLNLGDSGLVRHDGVVMVRWTALDSVTLRLEGGLENGSPLVQGLIDLEF